MKKSEKIAGFFTALALQEKWRSNRADFIFILLNMRRKDSIIEIAGSRDIWSADGFTQFALVEAIHKLKIPGYAREFAEMKKVAERDGDKQMPGYVNKYLAREQAV